MQSRETPPSIDGGFGDDANDEGALETPPSTPPVAKPQISKQVAQPLTSPMAKKEMKKAILSERVSLKGFIQNYSGSLPLRVKVLQGFYGSTAELYTGEVYDVFFKKLTQAVVIEDVSGNRYTVPLNSALQFGLMYDDHNPKFGTVSDILAMTILPKVICATSSYSTGKEESTIYKNELLIVLGVHVYNSKTKMGLGDILDAFGVRRSKKALRVLSLEERQEKIIDEQCSGDFITNPSHLALYLPEIVECVPEPFPSRACVFLDTESTSELPRLPKSLLSSPVFLKEVKTKVSLVASKVEGEESQIESPILMDIPVTGGFSEVEVEVAYEGNLTNKARNILESFDPMKLVSLNEANGNRSQDALNTAVRIGHEGDGISLESSCGTKNLSASEKKPDPISTQSNQAYETEETNFHEEDYADPSSNDSIPTPPATAPHPRGAPSQEQPSVAVIRQLAVISTQRHSRGEQQQSPSDNTADVDHTTPSTGYHGDQDYDSDSYELVDPSPIDTSEGQDYVPIDTYVTMHPSLYSKLPRPVPAFGSPNAAPALVERLHGLEVQRKKDRHFLEQTAARVGSLSEQLQSLQKTVEELLEVSKHGESLARADDGKSSAVTQDEVRAELSVNADSETAADNRVFLKGLDAVQVLKLLKEMSLEQYAEAFRREQIDGEVLSDLDDSTLQADLGIGNKIHRIRLAKVIDGRLSARSILGL